MPKSVRLTPIRRGYPYTVTFNFPVGLLFAGETLRAELRAAPGVDPAISFTAERAANAVMLSLTATQTGSLDRRLYVADLTLRQTNGFETPLTEHRYEIPAEDHVTRATA